MGSNLLTEEVRHWYITGSRAYAELLFSKTLKYVNVLQVANDQIFTVFVAGCRDKEGSTALSTNMVLVNDVPKSTYSPHTIC